MAIYKRHETYWAKAKRRGKDIRRSLNTQDAEVAREKYAEFIQKIDFLYPPEPKVVEAGFSLPVKFAKEIEMGYRADWADCVEITLRQPRNEIRQMFNAMRARALKRNIPCAISFDEMVAIWKKSGGACAVSGIRFLSRAFGKSRVAPWKASIDRIDPSLGYTAGNCRLVCNAVNIAMMDFGEDILIAMLAAILFKQRGTISEKERAQCNIENI